MSRIVTNEEREDWYLNHPNDQYRSCPYCDYYGWFIQTISPDPIYNPAVDGQMYSDITLVHYPCPSCNNNLPPNTYMRGKVLEWYNEHPHPFFIPKPVHSAKLDDLIKLRDSCLTLFDKQSLKVIPDVAIEPDTHFRVPALAHYHTGRNLICYKASYLESGDYTSFIDTMKHELLHAWIDQHNFSGDRGHDDVFQAAAHLLGIQWREDYRNA
jgi:hypothetical protein